MTIVQIGTDLSWLYSLDVDTSAVTTEFRVRRPSTVIVALRTAHTVPVGLALTPVDKL